MYTCGVGLVVHTRGLHAGGPGSIPCLSPLFFHRHILFQVIIIIHFIFYIKNIIISIMSCMINEDNGNIE